MRFSFILALCLTVVLATAHWYQVTKYICPVPIEYRLGVIDDSFSITDNEAKAAISEAADIWESQIDQDLFIYNEEADFEINFVFDQRQAGADAQASDRTRLDSIAEQSDEFKDRIDDLQKTYESQQSDFHNKRGQYDRELQEYNTRVRQANDRGGATPDVFAELEDERVRLKRVSSGLSNDATALNNLAQQLNELSTEGNRLIDGYNREVKDYNNQYGETHEFTQGDYQGGEINVYKFSDNNELVSVLAHEFGHALGVDHIEDNEALMYYLLDDELFAAPTLSAGDIAAYRSVCEDQGVAGTVRAIIRQFISKF